MERPSALSNVWLLVQTAGWIMALEGVADYISERHYETVLRRLLVFFLGCDPARPKVPTTPQGWEEWYNS
jgi:hypothetical protein